MKDGYIPIIGGSISNYGGIEYRSSSNGVFEELTLSKLDWELIQEFYEYTYIFITAYGFETKNDMYKDFVTPLLHIKNTSEGKARDIAKILLNGAYGKLGMNGIVEKKEYFIDKGIIKSKITDISIDETMFQYIPQAIAITAGARYILLKTAKKIGFENVYYMDTDSIKFKGDIPNHIEISDTKLGAWKDELKGGKADIFKSIAPKKYIYYVNKELHVACAGFNKHKIIPELLNISGINLISNIADAEKVISFFEKGFTMDCLQSIKAVGGRALIPVKKSIN